MNTQEIINNFFEGKSESITSIPDGTALYASYLSEINSGRCSSCLRRRLKKKYEQIIVERLKNV